MHPDSHGTSGDDVFTGTDADEHYVGRGGDDMISGGGGRDHLSGGEGKDTIHGGTSHDHLYGGAGNDLIYGGSGDDIIKSGDGHDLVHGGQGDDYVKPDSADGGDTLYGDAGNDILADDHSTLHGGAGDDRLSGLGTIMDGGAGNDTMTIRAPFEGDDYIGKFSGGSGADSFIIVTGGGDIHGGQLEIRDLSHEDHIDLSSIDAIPDVQHPGDQAFKIVPKFDGHAGELTITYDAATNRTLIELYTDADSKPDATIWTPGDHHHFTNFTL